MTDLTGKLISDTYKQLLQVNASTTNTGVKTSLTNVQSGDGTASALNLGTTAIKVSGTFGVHGNASVSGGLLVSDGVCASAFYGDGSNLSGLTASIGGSISVGNALVDGTLSVTGNAIFDANVTVSGTFDVAGNTSVGGTLTATGATQLGSTVTVVGKGVFEGDVSVSGDLDVATNASVGGTLAVTGASTFTAK